MADRTVIENFPEEKSGCRRSRQSTASVMAFKDFPEIFSIITFLFTFYDGSGY